MSPRKIVAVVLAGGFGTRIRHLLPDLPKPMASVNGRPFLEWVVRYLRRRRRAAGVIISTGHKAEMVARAFRPAAREKCSGELRAGTAAAGTAGGFLNAIRGGSRKPRDWLVLNGDSLALANLDDRCLQPLTDAVGAGVILGVQNGVMLRVIGTVITIREGWLTGFQEKPPGAGIINAGVIFAALLRRWSGNFPDTAVEF